MAESAGRILTRFAPMIYGPTLLFALGEGAVIPLIPVIAAELGANVASGTNGGVHRHRRIVSAGVAVAHGTSALLLSSAFSAATDSGMSRAGTGRPR